MGKKKTIGRDDDVAAQLSEAADEPVHCEPAPKPKSVWPSLSVGDILALLALIVLSAALLLEGYHKEFKDYSKEIVALFAVVVGFLLGRKT